MRNVIISIVMATMQNKLMALVVVFLVGGLANGVIISADADGYSEGTNISTAFGGMTLSSVGRAAGIDGNVYAYGSELASTGTNVFGHNLSNHTQWYLDAHFPAPWHLDDFAFRVDFAQLANSVGIDMIADNSWDYALLYAYDSSGELLEWVESSALMTVGEVFRATIDRDFYDIAYIIAGGMYANAPTPVYLDNLTANVIPEPATFYYVNAADGSDDNNGLSPETPFATIQKGIDSANDGDTVIVADGTYTGEGNRGIDFLGKAIIVRSKNGPESCVIDCQNLSRAFFFRNGEDANSVLDGFTVTNGYDTSGGGILCLDSSPVIANCIITANHAGAISGKGGGIECLGGNPLITNCVISGNSANAVGGAIFCRYSSPTTTNCTITGNSAGAGGAIHCYESNAAVTNCILWDNRAKYGSQIGLTSTHSNRPCTLSLNYTDLQGGQDNVFVSNWSTLNWGPGNIDADPCFVAWGYRDHNGTPDNVWDDFWVDGNYYLLSTSPCIDTGDPNYVGGPNEMDLDGNPRVINGDQDGLAVIDMGAYEYLPPVEARMKLTPQTLNCAGKSKFVKAHITLPEEIFPEDIDVNTPAVADPPDIDSEYIKLIGGDTGPVKLEITFSRAAFCETLTEPGQIEITVSGFLTTGQEFYATDTIRIKKTPTRRKSINRAQPARRLRPHNKSLLKLERQEK